METANIQSITSRKGAFSPIIHLGARAQLLPVSKKFKTNTRKIQKIPNFFCVVDNLMREVRIKFQLIWIFE